MQNKAAGGGVLLENGAAVKCDSVRINHNFSQKKQQMLETAVGEQPDGAKKRRRLNDPKSRRESLGN